MKALAVRDDGAVLVGDDNLSHGLLVGDDGRYVVNTVSVLTRGAWEDPGDEPVPDVSQAEQDAVDAASGPDGVDDLESLFTVGRPADAPMEGGGQGVG